MAPPDCSRARCPRPSARCWTFCSRTVPAATSNHGDDLREQLKLLGLYAFGLVSGAFALFVLRKFCLEILHRNTPEAAAMIGRFAVTMVFVGLLQSLALGRSPAAGSKISLLYGGLGIAYWLALLFRWKNSGGIAANHARRRRLAFGALFLAWLIAMRPRKIGGPAQS